MPKISFNKEKLHYVGISESLFNKVQAKATVGRLYVTQFVHKVLESSVDDGTKKNISRSDEDQF